MLPALIDLLLQFLAQGEGEGGGAGAGGGGGGHAVTVLNCLDAPGSGIFRS